MKKCAFLTLEERGEFVIDDECAIRPLAEIGWQVSTVSWRQTRQHWSAFDAVIIRSTWDYWNDVPAFLETLAQINRETRLANPLDLVHWNLAKTYMRDLEGNGIGIVPTLWAQGFSTANIGRWCRELAADELVVKPVIGANGEDAFRLSRNDSPERLEGIAGRFRDREFLVQRFMPEIIIEGEFSLFFFAGDFSHAILKKPAEDEFRSQEEHGAEIRLVTPGGQLLKRAHEALETIEPKPLYARIDFVRTGTVDFVVMELELIEPSMYLRMEPEAPARFARAIDRWFYPFTAGPGRWPA